MCVCVCACRDFMDPTMDSTKHILNYLMPILEQVDPELHHFMLRYLRLGSVDYIAFLKAGAAWKYSLLAHDK